jgi:hypothetical protein
MSLAAVSDAFEKLISDAVDEAHDEIEYYSVNYGTGALL